MHAASLQAFVLWPLARQSQGPSTPATTTLSHRLLEGQNNAFAAVLLQAGSRLLLFRMEPRPWVPGGVLLARHFSGGGHLTTCA